MGTGKTYSTKYLLDSNNNTGAAGQVLSTTSTGIDWVDANTVPGAGLWLESGNDIYNSNSGNVGIGTTTPQRVLDVNVGGNSGVGASFAGAISAGEYQGIHFGYSEAGNANYRKSALVFERDDASIGDATGKIHILNNASGSGSATLADSRVTILKTGNVGIGTTSPGAKLDIAAVTNAVVRLTSTGNGLGADTALGSLQFYGNDASVPGAGIKSSIVAKTEAALGDDSNLIFSTSDGTTNNVERMRITSGGLVGIGTTNPSIAPYRLTIGDGDIYAQQAVAKITLGQFGSQGDAHFGASGLGSPTVGSQDYGFYSAHNAYRTSTGAWKHSRTSTIGAVRILGGGGGSSGNAGFSFDYSANNGTSDITWTNLMHLSTGGNLQLPEYGAGVLVSDGNGTITSTNDINISGDIVMGDNLINYPFTPLNNQSTQYWLLCYNSASNDVNGSIIGDRTSGHHQAMNLDIVLSSKNNSMQTGMISSQQVLENNEKYTLVTLTYNSNSYVAIKYVGHLYPSSGSYFTGLLKSSIGSDFLLALNPTQVSSVAAFSNANTKATIQAAKVGIGTADPGYKLEVNEGNGIFVGDGGVPVLLADSSTGIFKIGDTDELGDGVYATNTSTSSFDIYSTGSLRFRMDSSGNVGIGGNSPSYLLDVRDGTTSGAIARFTAINPHVIIESSTAGAAVLHFKPNTTGTKSGQFKVTAGNGYNFRWSNDAAGTGEVSYMTLDTSTTGGGDLTVKGDVIAYGAPSDRKYKENIKPIESALDKAMQLQGVTFDWKDSESILDIKEDIGFIAQDVEKVLPELVRDSGKGNLSLRYQGITPILLEAIKELKAEIDLLKSKMCNCNNCNCNI